MNNTDLEYNRLVELVLKRGRKKNNRTGVPTIGVFGEQAKFDVSLDAFPILTTKKVWFKGIVHELLWFISGSTNIKYLVDNDVHIWDEWAYNRISKLSVEMKANFPTLDTFISHLKWLPRDDVFVLQYGELGEGTYGGMWREFPYFYEKEVPNPNGGEQKFYHPMEGNVDQIQGVLDTLKNDPDSRRMIVSAWHPFWAHKCALSPCHVLFQFNTEELTEDERVAIYVKDKKSITILSPEWYYVGGKAITRMDWLDSLNIPKRRLNLMLTQRSCDLPCGIPFNITSYSLLLAMFAQCVNMESGTFVHNYGDLHIYEDQIEGINEQLSRESKILPKLWLNPEIKNLLDFKYEDIKLVDYISHPSIKFPVAV
jgi:thymidylate synthase